ncbi:MAG TPA: M43 family zinc metalloprotease [Flavobacteriales bacterium]|nr:M43 family zinc metalloprotease [Flavobacteriales bacterium]
MIHYSFRILLLLSIILSFQLTHAQSHQPCASDFIRLKNQENNPNLLGKEKEINNQLYQALLQVNHVERSIDRTIPIVIHIIHQNGDENISDALVIQGIAHLNQAFSNSGAYSQANGVNTHIQFCLAQQDETGLPTTGITRHISELTNMNVDSQDEALKSIIQWDPTRYLNIWLVNEINSVSMGNGVAGYATFPNNHGNSIDGIVNEASYFGSSVDNSKVHIHEAGHYLGLYHTFNGGCANLNCALDGDLVCDTPPDNSSDPVNCTLSANTCHTDSDDASLQNPFRAISLGGLGDQPDLFVNYMDYGYQACQHLFSQGQSDRMNAMLDNPRESLNESTGCENSCGVYASGTNVPNYNPPYTLYVNSSILLEGYSQATVPHHFEWLVNGQVQGSDSLFTFQTNAVGYYQVLFRIYNSELNCYSQQETNFHVICGLIPIQPTYSPAIPQLGEPVHFNADLYQVNASWYVNDNYIGGGYSLDYYFPSAGEYQVQLIASNGFCADTSQYIYVPVGSCNRGESLRWWFGSGTELSFFGSNPIINNLTTNPYFVPNEGVSNICDLNGNLLLITDGTQVNNGQGQLVGNGMGLLGGNSSSQAALIIPNPSYNSIYYVFTTDHFGGQWYPTGGGLSYTSVDVTANDGQGVVVDKNVNLYSPTCEKQSAVKHCNGHDIWHVSHAYGTDEFYAYLITDSGIDPTPVISHVGITHGALNDGGMASLGCMKISPQGDKLALNIHMPSDTPTQTQLFDFDNSTGIVSNALTIPADIYTMPYGVEFSPDGSKLYISNSMPSYHQAEIYQLDLSSGNPEEILASRQLIGNSSADGNGLGSLQLAKNGKIYCARSGSYFIDEISFPNINGTACHFIDKAVPVNFYNYGLPNLVSSFAADLTPTIDGPSFICANSTAQYTIRCGHPGNTDWSYSGAGTLQIQDAEHVNIQSGLFAGAGTLIVSRDAGCEGMLYDTLIVQIGNNAPDLGNDTLICQTGNIHLSPGTGYTSYLWQNGSTMSYQNANGPGTYWVKTTSAGGCQASDTIHVTGFTQPFSISLGEDQSFCMGTDITIHAPAGDFSSYHWSNGSEESSTNIGYPTSLSLAVSNSAGCIARDTILIQQNSYYPIFQFQDPSYLCPGTVLVLETGYPNFENRWQDFSNQHSYTVFQPGVYWATVNSGCGYFWTDSVHVLSGENPTLNLGNDTVLCPFNPFLLIAGESTNQYLWENESSDTSRVISAEGLYSVQVTNTQGCISLDSIDVKVCPLDLNKIQEDAFLIYPNPGEEIVQIRPSNTIQTIRIFNALGQKCGEYRLQSGEHEINLQKLKSGVYFIQMVEGNSIRTVRWIRE